MSFDRLIREEARLIILRALEEQSDGRLNSELLRLRATRGKYLRAEPVAALYAQGRVRHVGAFPALEDELCDFGPGGLSSGRSPDRLDALVWALTHLMLTSKARPRVRGI